MRRRSRACADAPRTMPGMFAVACLFFGFGIPAMAQSPPESTPLVDRLRRLQNVSVRLRTTISFFPSETFLDQSSADVQSKVIRGSFGYHDLFRFLDGRAYYDRVLGDETQRRLKEQKPRISWPIRTVTVVNHERAEIMTQSMDAPRPIGIIRNDWHLPDDSWVEMALGIRCFEEKGWLDVETLQRCQWERTPDGLLMGTWDIASTEVQRSRHLHRWRFDPRRGYALVSYHMAEGQDAFVVWEVHCTEFKTIDGLPLPYKVSVRQLAEENGKPVVRIGQEMQIEEYAVGDLANTPDSFHVSWPGKAFVKDMRSGTLVKQATTGPISDAQIAEVGARRQQRLNELASRSQGRTPLGVWVMGAAVTGALIGVALWLKGRQRSKTMPGK